MDVVEVFGLMILLIIKVDGIKMGKFVLGVVWFNFVFLFDYDYW